jgi:hypothetical protein
MGTVVEKNQEYNEITRIGSYLVHYGAMLRLRSTQAA